VEIEKQNYQYLKEEALKAGATLFGVCKLDLLKNELVDISFDSIKDMNYAISLAVRLSDKIIEDIKDHPTKLYFYHYRQVNYFLDRIALQLTVLIQGKGYDALPIPSSQTVNWNEQKGHLSHKKIAFMAGLGWIGRNNLLVNPDFGSRLRLVTVITNIPLSVDIPVKLDCGNCKDCISVCPAGAIKETKEQFDHRACFEQLDIFRKKYNIGHHICGVCVKSCRGHKKY